mmetsp:Transcript_15571/g.20282  ORF Transcript_15571/g.20282 Transcript_15571/m.20282 type:complete len:138 (-) Transcript_15571:393-806(-)
MAIGPFARIIAQVIVPLVAVMAKALPAAYAQALQNARKAGMSPNTVDAASNILSKTIAKEEALQILNLKEAAASVEAIQQQYEKYMAANDVSKGGSFYLQSKVYRAKEMLDKYTDEQKDGPPKEETSTEEEEQKPKQ